MKTFVETFPTLRHACKFVCYGIQKSKSMKAARNYLLKAIKHDSRAYGYKPIKLLDGEVKLIKVVA